MLSINFGMQITSRFVKRLMKNTDSFNHGAVICYFKHAFNGHSNDNFKISDWNCVTDNCFFEILMSRGEMPIDLIVLRVRSIISFFFLFGDNSMSHFTQNRNENRKTPANIHQWMEWLFNIISMYEYWVSICLFLPIFLLCHCEHMPTATASHVFQYLDARTQYILICSNGRTIDLFCLVLPFCNTCTLPFV